MGNSFGKRMEEMMDDCVDETGEKMKGKKEKPAVSKDSWETPTAFFDYWDNYYKFELDVAASAENYKGPFFIDAEMNGLTETWGRVNWCNPPFSLKSEFIAKAQIEAYRGNTTLMLLPASTGAEWFVRMMVGLNKLFFIGGRLKFVGAASSADFDVCLAEFSPNCSKETMVRWVALPPEKRR